MCRCGMKVFQERHIAHRQSRLECYYKFFTKRRPGQIIHQKGRQMTVMLKRWEIIWREKKIRAA